MIRLLLSLFLFALSVSVTNAEDKNIPPERMGWMQRIILVEAIAKVRKLREARNWCAAETKKQNPDLEGCRLAERLKKVANLEHEVTMIRTGIREMKAAPATLVIQEHIHVLEAALGEITYNLRSTDNE